jgi:hypothetical protein
VLVPCVILKSCRRATCGAQIESYWSKSLPGQEWAAIFAEAFGPDTALPASAGDASMFWATALPWSRRRSAGRLGQGPGFPDEEDTSSDDEEVQVAAYRCQRFAADSAQLAPGSLIGHGADLLRHGIRGLLQPRVIICGNRYVMVEAAIAGRERYREEKPRDRRVPMVRHYDDRAYAALLPASYRIKVAE